jgi:hypothetical protein
MTAASSSRGIGETVARIVWFSLASPRQAVRELFSAANFTSLSWIIVTLSIAITTIWTGISTWLSLRRKSDPSAYSYFSPGQEVFEAGASALAAMVVNTLIYPLEALLWMYVFGFRGQARLVWAAVVASFALSIVIDPILDVALYQVARPETIGAEGMVFGLYLIAAISFSSYYYAEALSIGLLKAFLINSAVFTMLIVGIVITVFIFAILLWGRLQ